jgi:hypothetical protein
MGYGPLCELQRGENLIFRNIFPLSRDGGGLARAAGGPEGQLTWAVHISLRAAPDAAATQ